MKIASRGLGIYKETHTHAFSQRSEVFPIVSLLCLQKLILFYKCCTNSNLQISKTQGNINYELFQVVRNIFINEIIRIVRNICVDLLR